MFLKHLLNSLELKGHTNEEAQISDIGETRNFEARRTSSAKIKTSSDIFLVSKFENEITLYYITNGIAITVYINTAVRLILWREVSPKTFAY